jgi:Spy/CpxP family protein refolding chaperone
VKFNRFLQVILTCAWMIPIAALAQTGNSATNSGEIGSAAAHAENGERAEKFAQQLNLSPDQQAALQSIRQNEKQQAQAIKNDSSLNAEQKKAKFKELRRSSHQEMMSKLTPDQQQKLKALRKEHRGHRHDGDGEFGAKKQE